MLWEYIPFINSEWALSVESFKVMDVLQRANQFQAEGDKILHCEVVHPESGVPGPVAANAVWALTQQPNREVMGYTDAFGMLRLR